jgi:Tfp pilus assembly protein PilF
MSLLMEALKKAERAKQAAEGAAGEAAAPESGDQPGAQSGELQLAGEDASLAAAVPAETPADTAAPATPNRDPRHGRVDFPRLELESIDDREFDLDPVKPRGAARETPATEARGRATARTVFEAKQAGGRNRNPLIIGSLALLAVLGIGTYFAVQIFSSGGSSLTGPQLASGPVPPRPALPPPAAPAPATPVVAPAAVTLTPTPAPAAAETAKPVEPAPGVKIATFVARPAPKADIVSRSGVTPVGANLSAAGQRKAQAPGDVHVSPPSVRANPVLNSAYDAYLANNIDAARNGYAAVLERDPANRDALLGLAGIAAREQHYADAETLYLRVLNHDPLDIYAQAGLIAIRSPANPVAAETRLKTLIASKPDAAFLHYALGNLYAGQQRWNDAEQEHFRAFALDSDNADYCYNLAVALDHMRQSREALAHYQRALTLATATPASFDADRLRARIGELQQQ